MEEIDIENIEDVSDLEARLYAQVHHEGLNEGSNSNSENNKGDCFTTVTKDLPRYWENHKPASTITKNSIMSEQNSQRSACHIVRNPFTLGGQQQLQPPPNKKGKVQNINDKLPNNPISKPKKTKGANSLCLNPLAKPALRLNPAAAAAAARSKKGTKVDTINTPFRDRLLKIQKYKTLQNKRQKSNKINTARKFENKNEDVVEIEIDSDAESDSSDVIIIPLPPPQVVTIDESDDEKLNKLNKSQDISPIKSAQVTNPAERQTHNSSPCCSILSSDDFIEQHDRSRLLANSSNVADDADLLLLVAQVDNLTQTNKHSISKTAAKTANSTFPKEFVKIDDMDSNEDVLELNTIKKPSVINVIDSDSEIMENAAANSLPNRKRKMSTQHNERKTNNMILESDDDNEEDDDEMRSGVQRTSISYIARGPAVEQRSVRKRIVTPEEGGRRRCRRKSSNTSAGVGECSGNMSDKEFITTLNHLIQGNDTEDDSETESVPTARELAERVLSKRRKTTTTAIGEDAAIPESICENLNEVFQTIDQLNDKNNANRIENDSYIIEAPVTGSGEERPTITIDDDHDDVQLLIDDDVHEGDKTISQVAQKYTTDGSPIYNVTFLERDCVPSVGAGVGWNDEMHKFYNSSWKGESFQLSRVLQEMDPDKSLWKIYSEDRFNKPLRRNLKCLNCCEFGHVRSKCKRPRKPLVCYMCGERGHREPRCPNTICLRCGNKTQVFMKSCNACTFQNRLICPICKVRGHSIDLCPDKWRRYHSTIEPNVFPKHGIEYNTKKYCYVCGARGHLGENCRNSVRFLEYPVIISSVKSHTKSYADLAIKSSFEIPQTGIGLNLMYKPSDGFNFDLAVNTEKDKVYGRFLTAVGMGSLLNRPTLETAKISNDPVMNQNAPNQVQEVSESGSIAEEVNNNNETTDTTLQSNHLNEINDNEIEEIIDIEPESSIIENIELHVNVGNTPTKNQNISSPPRISPTLLMIDSDSNYSFSEHFDVSSTSNTTFGENTTNITETNETKQALDFIPLVNATKKSNNQDNNNKRKTKPQNEGEKNNSDNNKNPPCDEPLPCKAKIYLRNFHSKYLLSPEGRTFLNNLANNCKVQAGINFSSVGYVLIIYGLQAAQDEFHKHLLKKYDELDEQENSHNGNVLQNIPKRTDALIRFLRENIGQLLNNLGNVNELFRRMKYLEKQHSKSGSKMADKVRRLLNMILVGQGGLSDGKMHLDKLMVSLRCLMYDHLGEEVAPVQLRSTITEHWKMIFSPYRHSNYQQLVQAYNTLVSQHGFPTINVDPILLGRKSMQFPAEARQQSDAGNCSLPPSIGENQLNPQNVANPTFMSEDTTNQRIIPPNNSTDITLNVSNTSSHENRENQNVAKVTELNISSPFWSRECIQYLDRCIHKVSTQPHVIEKLQRVRNKSKRGELSYNDYLAVIKLHKTLLGK